MTMYLSTQTRRKVSTMDTFVVTRLRSMDLDWKPGHRRPATCSVDSIVRIQFDVTKHVPVMVSYRACKSASISHLYFLSPLFPYFPIRVKDNILFVNQSITIINHFHLRKFENPNRQTGSAVNYHNLHSPLESANTSHANHSHTVLGIHTIE